MTRDELLHCIPHRPPFLWLDEVVAVDETSLHARKFLDPELEVFTGHYPHFPVFPGALQCEACFQAGAVLISQLMQPADDEIPVVTRVNNVKFRHLVRPGETLDIEVRLAERLRNAYFLTGKVSANGRVSTRLEFAVATTALSAER